VVWSTRSLGLAHRRCVLGGVKAEPRFARSLGRRGLLQVARFVWATEGRRPSHYSIALGSARESLVALRAAAAWGYIRPVSPEMTNSFNTVIGTLVRTLVPKH
jgi:hypothetical protein